MSLWTRDHEDWAERARQLAGRISESLRQANFGDADAARDDLSRLLGSVAAQDIHTRAWAVGMNASDQLKIRNYGRALEGLSRMARLLDSPEPDMSRPAVRVETPADAGPSL